jgi:hypothetical protein
LPGVHRSGGGLIGGSNDQHREKLRPGKEWVSEPKYDSNKNGRPWGKGGWNQPPRLANKVSAITDAKDTALSKSLLELLPTHANNPQTSVQTALAESLHGIDEDILYSFDNKGPSPGSKGRDVDLGGLVDIAEQRWKNDQIEKIVRGEYEVLDEQGETVVVKKSKKSPKTKATKIVPVDIRSEFDEDEGFELI